MNKKRILMAWAIAAAGCHAGEMSGGNSGGGGVATVDPGQLFAQLTATPGTRLTSLYPSGVTLTSTVQSVSTAVADPYIAVAPGAHAGSIHLIFTQPAVIKSRPFPPGSSITATCTNGNSTSATLVGLTDCSL